MDRTKDSLIARLRGLDGKGYPQYKSLKGSYDYGALSFRLDHVQGDPFAQPSRVAFLLSLEQHGFDCDLYASRDRAVALCDAVARKFSEAAGRYSKLRGSGKGGIIEIDAPGQEVLARTACQIDAAGEMELRFFVGLPAHGRRIFAEAAAIILGEEIVKAAEASLFAAAHDLEYLQRYTQYNEDARWLRGQLRGRGLVAFVANAAILPRQSGIDDQPLAEGAVSFQAPPELEVSFTCPNGNHLTGMGIRQGVTLIVGGGFHGKSTLLEALKRGVYNHVLGDGREWVITEGTAVKIRAEDGRSVGGVDISPFIDNLPQAKSTENFSTQNASGSTSQAAAIVEAIEADAQTLLIDEDTSATNFMIRDQRMQELIAKEREPITPFVDRVRQIYAELGISTVIVMGGSGDYFDHADTVIAMNAYQPEELTARAKEVAANHSSGRQLEGKRPLTKNARKIDRRASSAEFLDRGRSKIRLRGTDELTIGRSVIDCTYVEQLVDSSQLRAIGYYLNSWLQSAAGESLPLAEIIRQGVALLSQQGLDALSGDKLGDLAEFRGVELAQVISRMRQINTI